MALLLRRLLALALLPLALTACTDDGSSSAGGDAPATAAEISGSVVKGITANAVISVYAPDGDGLELLATGRSNEQGAFSITLPEGFEGVVKLVVTPSSPPDAPTQMRCDAPTGCYNAPGGTLYDYGEWFDVPADFEMSAVASVTGTGIQMINVTPLSTLAAALAATFPQGLDPRSADAANEQVAAMFGFSMVDIEQGAGDITDEMWAGLADPKQIQLALLYAAFAELAAQNGLTSQGAMDAVLRFFTEHDGSLYEADSPDAFGPTLAALLTETRTLTGVIDIPDGASLDVQDSIDDLLARLEAGTLLVPREVTLDDLLGSLGTLGEDLDELLQVTGLNDPHQFILDQGPYFSWILANDNLKLVPLAVDVVVNALIGSLKLDLPEASLDFYNTNETSTFTLDSEAKTLHITGVRHMQTVDLTLGLTGLLSGLEDGELQFSISGTAENGTAEGEIEGVVMIGLEGSQFDDLIDALRAVQGTEPGSEAYDNAIDLCFQELGKILPSLDVIVTLDGGGELTNKASPSMTLAADVVLTGFLDVGQAMAAGLESMMPGLSLPGLPTEPGTIATLVVSSGNIELPNGDHLEGIPDTPILVAEIAEDATVKVDGSATLFGLPEAVLDAQGTLFNARELFGHLGITLVAGILGQFDVDELVDALLDFDFSQVGVYAAGTVDIKAAGILSRDHQYRAALEDLTITVFQPHSEEVAATAELDFDHQAVHMTLGGEPWDLRVMTTPTPRLLLLGPDGQYATVSQEDVFAFLDTLPLGDLLGGLFPTAPAPAP
ncbi:MAG: hypothetical protein ACOY3X_07455 [Pseudomonadota bacterium]